MTGTVSTSTVTCNLLRISYDPLPATYACLGTETLVELCILACHQQLGNYTIMNCSMWPEIYLMYQSSNLELYKEKNFSKLRQCLHLVPGQSVGKVLGNQRKTCSLKDPVLSLVPEYKVKTLYSGTGTEPEFWCWVLRKRCVHIGAQLRILPGHQVWTLP